MMPTIITSVHIPQTVLNMPRDFQAAIEGIVNDSRDTLEAFVARSIRQRWYDTGRSVRSFTIKALLRRRNGGEIEAESGTPYDAFGEFGTGTRGAASGVVHPATWRYGTVRGIAARRMYGKALDEATPVILAAVNRRMGNFKRGGSNG